MSFRDVFARNDNAVFPAESAVLDTEPTFGPNGTEFTPNYHPTTPAETAIGVGFGSNSGETGTFAGSGGSGTDHTEQLNRIEAQTSQIIGTSLKWCGPVKDGGFVILHKGIDYVPAISTQILIPIDDVGGSIHAQLTAASTTLMTFEASRDLDSSEILGLVVSSSHSDDVTTVAVQIESTATSDATPAADYAYHVKFGDDEGRTGLAFVGDLELKEQRA